MTTITDKLFITEHHSSAHSKVEMALSSYSISKVRANCYELATNPTGAGMFSLMPITVQIELIPHGRHMTKAMLTAHTEGEGVLHRSGCKTLLRSIAEEISK